MKKRCLALVLILVMIAATPLGVFAEESTNIIEELFNKDFEGEYTSTNTGYVSTEEYLGSKMLKFAASDNPGSNKNEEFAVAIPKEIAKFEVEFKLAIDIYPSNATQYFYIQLMNGGTALFEMRMENRKDGVSQYLRTINGGTNFEWTNHTNDNFVAAAPTVCLVVDRTSQNATVYINGVERATYTLSEMGRAALATTDVTTLRFYRYRESIEAGFYIDDVVVRKFTEKTYDPTTLALNFDAEMDYKESNPKLIIKNGTDSEYLAQDFVLSLVNVENDEDVTEIKISSAEKTEDGVASFEMAEEISVAPGWYYVTIQRKIDGILKGNAVNKKLYIASTAQLNALPDDFTSLSSDETTAVNTVKGYLPCFLTEEEINELMPPDDATLADANLTFITRYFQNSAKIYAAPDEVKADFDRAKTYLELKNSKNTVDVKSTLNKGGYLDEYVENEIFAEFESEFFEHFETKRTDNDNLILSDEAVATALEYSLAMTSLNNAKRSEIEGIVSAYSDIFGIDISAEGVDDVSPDELYAALYNKSYKDVKDIQSDWSARLVDLLSEREEDDIEEEEDTTSSNKRGGGGGGGVSFKTPTSVPEETPKIEPAPSVTLPFTDIDGHWSYENIEILYKKNIITGYKDNTFRPNNKLTRGEFVVMLARILPGEEGHTIDFSDVSESDWYAKAVAEAVCAGVVQGADGKFMPNSPITREQLAVMIYRALAPDKAETENLNFADAGEISEYAKEAVSYLVSRGMLSGFEDNTMRPKRETSRAETAKLLSVLCSELSK